MHYISVIDITKLHNQDLEVLRILEASSFGKAAFVGGYVRDFLLYNKCASDVDISTTLLPEEVIKQLKKAEIISKNLQKFQKNYKNFHIFDKYKHYGTITLIWNDRHYEITTTRNDIQCYGREANISFCKSFKQDSNRRDFTINALYLRQDGTLVDFHNGLVHLQEKMLCFIGNIEQRMQEDYLRIIRYYRFIALLNNHINDNIRHIIKKNKVGLKNISIERFQKELFKLLSYENWTMILKYMFEDGILEYFYFNLIELNEKIPKNIKNYQGNYFYIIKLLHVVNFNDNIITNFKCTKDEKNFIKFYIKYCVILENIDLSNIEHKIILYNIKYDHNISKEYYAIIYNIWIKSHNDIVLYINNLHKLPIDGDELIILGIEKKNINIILQKLIRQWIHFDFTISKERLILTLKLDFIF